jgi:hypothetical protein
MYYGRIFMWFNRLGVHFCKIMNSRDRERPGERCLAKASHLLSLQRPSNFLPGVNTAVNVTGGPEAGVLCCLHRHR